MVGWRRGFGAETGVSARAGERLPAIASASTPLEIIAAAVQCGRHGTCHTVVNASSRLRSPGDCRPGADARHPRTAGGVPSNGRPLTSSSLTKPAVNAKSVLASKRRWPTTAADAVVVGLFADAAPTGPAADADRATGGLIAKLIERKEITGKRYELTPLWPRRASRPGSCWSSAWATEQLTTPARPIAPPPRPRQHLAGKPRERVAFFLGDGGRPRHGPKRPSPARSPAAKARICIGPKRNASRSTNLLWAGGNARPHSPTAQILGESINLTRRLVNEPPHEMYPESFADEAEEVAERVRAERSKSGTRSGSRPSAAARCWRWPADRTGRRGW